MVQNELTVMCHCGLSVYLSLSVVLLSLVQPAHDRVQQVARVHDFLSTASQLVVALCKHLRHCRRSFVFVVAFVFAFAFAFAIALTLCFTFDSA